jgi:uncharacterized protein (DUF58 family)
MPAQRTFVVVGLLSLLLLVGVLEPWLAEAVLAADLLLLLAVLVDGYRGGLTTLRASRVMPPVLAQGAPAGCELQLTNAARRSVTVIAREALHPSVSDGPLRRRFTIPAGHSARWSYILVPRRRGEPLLGPLSVRILGPWGLAWGQRDLLPAEARRVYPQTRWEGHVGRVLALAHRHELGQSPLRSHGLGREPYALREYLPGDPLAKIHWKASARHGRLISREEAWERGRPLVILLDCARAMVSLDGQRSKLDHALAAALALTRVAMGRGDRVTIVAFSDRIERLVRVHTGAHGVARAYGALFDLAPRLAEPAFDLAAETVERAETRRATLVSLTSVVDLAAAELLRDSLVRLRRRHRVFLVNLEDADLGELALASPATVEEAFAKTAAIEALLANRRLGRSLSRTGIRVVSAPANRLAWSSLEAYLGVAARASRQDLSRRLA